MLVMDSAGAEGSLPLTEEDENFQSIRSHKDLEMGLFFFFSHPKAFSEKREEEKR